MLSLIDEFSTASVKLSMLSGILYSFATWVEECGFFALTLQRRRGRNAVDALIELQILFFATDEVEILCHFSPDRLNRAHTTFC